jgi:predicted tellurium resistance membrane protein TerC
MLLRVLLLVGFTSLAICAVAADEPPPEFRVETRDGRSVTGHLLNPTVRLKTAYGLHDIDARSVQRLTFSPPDTPGGHDVVEFTDDEHTQGQVQPDPIRIDSGGKVEEFRPDDLREMKAVKDEKLGIGPIIVGLVTLSAMEIVLGIDNIIFLAIVAGKLPEAQQPRARRIGLVAALGTRILLLLSLSFLLGLTRPLFTIPDLPYFHNLEAREVSLRDLILMSGGLFLIYKSVREMHEKLESAREGTQEADAKPPRAASFGGVLVQIAVLDIVFSLDSVITAVGMVDKVWIMVVAMVIAMAVMWVFADSVSSFVGRHPTIKVLALAFLILIGVMLVAESLGQHIDKGYIYFAMAFAVIIEMINLRLRRKAPVVPTKVTV